LTGVMTRVLIKGETALQKEAKMTEIEKTVMTIVKVNERTKRNVKIDARIAVIDESGIVMADVTVTIETSVEIEIEIVLTAVERVVKSAMIVANATIVTEMIVEKEVEGKVEEKVDGIKVKMNLEEMNLAGTVVMTSVGMKIEIAGRTPEKMKKSHVEEIVLQKGVNLGIPM